MIKVNRHCISAVYLVSFASGYESLHFRPRHELKPPFKNLTAYNIPDIALRIAVQYKGCVRHPQVDGV